MPAGLPANTGAAGTTKVAITPLPVQAPVPVWLPGWSEAAHRLATRLDVPILGAPFSSLGELVACYDTVRTAARRRGVAPLVPVVREVYLASTANAAWSAAEAALAPLYEHYRRCGLLPAAAEDFRRLATDRFIIGDPAQCLAEIERYRTLELFASALGPHLRMVG